MFLILFSPPSHCEGGVTEWLGGYLAVSYHNCFWQGMCNIMKMLELVLNLSSRDWCPTCKTSGIESYDGNKSLPWWVVLPYPACVKDDCASLPEIALPTVFPWMRKLQWATSWLKHCIAWRCLILLAFMPDTDWWWICVRQCWHLPLENHAGERKSIRSLQHTEREKWSKVRYVCLTQISV